MLSCQQIRLSERRELHRSVSNPEGGRRTCSARNNDARTIPTHKPLSAPPKTPLYITTLRLPLDYMPSPKKAPRPARSARCIRSRDSGITQDTSGSDFEKNNDLLISGTELPERKKREPPKPETEIIKTRFEPRLACCLRKRRTIPVPPPSKICSRAQRALSRDRGNAERRCRLSTTLSQDKNRPGAGSRPDCVQNLVRGTRTASPNTMRVIRVDLINLRPHLDGTDFCEDDFSDRSCCRSSCSSDEDFNLEN